MDCVRQALRTGNYIDFIFFQFSKDFKTIIFIISNFHFSGWIEIIFMKILKTHTDSQRKSPKLLLLVCIVNEKGRQENMLQVSSVGVH